MSDADSGRATRERDFHDRRFSEDTEARSADRFYSVTGSSGDAYVDAIDQLPAGARILEVGVGESMQALRLAQAGHEVVGIDISPVAVATATATALDENVSGATFREMNAETLDFEAGSFEVVIGSGIIHHLDIEASMSEFSRVLQPGGRALFLEPMGYNPAIELYRRFTPGQRTDDEHPLRRADFALMRRHFGKVDVRYFHLMSLAALALSRPSFENVLARLESADQWLFSHVPAVAPMAWFALVELDEPLAAATSEPA